MMINCAMKKITITSLAVLAMFAISCEKNDVTNDNKVNETPEVTLPKEYVSLTFGTNTEELATKTTYNQGEIEWTAGDKVKVLFNGGTNETEAASSGEATTFNVSVPSDATSIYFAYPSTESVSLNDGAVTLTIPAETDGAFANANYMVASALPTDEAITFYHAGSVFKVVVEDATITKAVITGNKGEALAGTVTYTFNEEGIEYGEASETSTSLTMNFNGAGTYYASALPGLTLEKGATIKFFRGENPAGGNCVSSAIPVRRACVASFGKDVEMCNRYVSTTGTGEGNGRTAAAAWNLSQFADFVSNKTSMSSEKLAALNGLTVHLAAGTYNLPSILDFRLGSNVVTLNIVGEDGATLNGNGHQILVQNQGDRDNTTVIFDNIIFTGGVCDNDNGGAIKHRDGTLVFKNCTFSGNQTNNNGGVFNMYNTANVIAENCHFYKNSSAGDGGVVHISDAKASASFKDCYFGDGTDANQNSAKNGGVFSFYHGNVTVEGCTFNNNKATEAAGAMFFSSTSTVTVNITSSSFLNHKGAANAGVLEINAGTVEINNSTFDSNSTPGSGAALRVNKNAKLVDNGSVYVNNTAKWGGAVAVNNSANVTFSGSKFGKDGDASKKNIASGGGGAININSGTVNVTKCEFYCNEAQGNTGGAIRHASDGDVTLTVTGCKFKGNINSYVNAGAGGAAIHFQKGNITIVKADDGTRNTFENNTSVYRGGALCIEGTGNAKVSECDFIGNSTTGEGGSIRLWGGAICVDESPKVELTNCLFDSNTSAALGGALAGIGTTASIKVNKCTFKDNSAKQGAAIANTSKGSTYYLNACVFTGNYSTDRYGTTIQFANNDNDKGGTTAKGSGTLCMNNVTIADNTYSTTATTGQQACWVNLKGLVKAVLSNSTMIGQTRNSGGPITESTTNLYRFDGNVGSGNYLINNIIAQTPASGTYYSCDIQSKSVNGYYNKMSTLKNATNYTTGQGDATDYRGTSSYFGGLNYVAGANPSWDNCYWSWNGTLAAGSNNEKATLENVNNTIKTADSNFHSWLNSIGALNTDGRGKSRGTNTWPGSYDGTNN